MSTRGLTARGLLSSEWLKLRSLRAPMLSLAGAGAAMIVVGVGISAYVGARYGSLGIEERAAFDPVTTPLLGSTLAQLALAAVGVLVVTTEYASGLIRTTLSVVPSRLPVLWAKATVVAVVGSVVVAVSCAGAVGVSQLLLPHDVRVSLAAPGVPTAVLGTAVYLVVVALLGLGVGFLTRSTAGALAAVVGVVLVLPTLSGVLPGTVRRNLVPYLPSEAGRSMMSPIPVPGGLSPALGLVVCLAWVAATLVGAAVVLRRRDV